MAIDQLDSMIMSLKTEPGENAKLTYSLEIFVGASLAILRSMGRMNIQLERGEAGRRIGTD